MQFHSFDFVIFFAVVFPLYCALNFRWQNRLLLAASYLFYGWVAPQFLTLMVLTTIFDFMIGLRIEDATEPAHRKRWLLCSIVMNLGILGFFKYFDFFLLSAAPALASIGFKVEPWLLRIALPVGISFYTFHEISYTVDVYRKHIRAARNFEDFAVFISFFPQLVAGPIGRASWQMPQFEKPRQMTWNGWCDGALLILIGFFKKVVIADSLAAFAEKPFQNPELCSSGSLLIGLYCFSIQIYADFSGYTDIARGLAKLFGFELIENFNQPYFSTNITEFWRRWHISLSTWLRDYLYIPLGGNRHGHFNTYRNLFLTMFLGGLWHGASWKFAIWGSLHGIYLIVHKLISERNGDSKPQNSWLIGALKTAFTFHLVAFAWIFFRAESLSDALAFVRGIFQSSPQASPESLSGGIATLISVLVLLLLIDLPQYLKRDHCAILKWPLPARMVVYAVLFFWIAMMRGVENVPFIYFQF